MKLLATVKSTIRSGDIQKSLDKIALRQVGRIADDFRKDVVARGETQLSAAPLPTFDPKVDAEKAEQMPTMTDCKSYLASIATRVTKDDKHHRFTGIIEVPKGLAPDSKKSLAFVGKLLEFGSSERGFRVTPRRHWGPTIADFRGAKKQREIAEGFAKEVKAL